MDLGPGDVIVWLFVGLIAGWLAGIVVRGGGFGMIGNIIVGIGGGLIGGSLFDPLFPGSTLGLVGSIVIAYIGAVIVLAVANLLRPRRAPAL
ncbi:MAG: GlsB/YeaQ/YmgE family stress response membrane protein [Dehalococcoidia bacterium]